MAEGVKRSDGPRHPRLVLATTILASSLSFIDGSFLLPLSALLLLGGAAGDLYGRRRLLIFGTGLFALASLACALAPSLAIFLAGRAAQGLGAALLLPSSLAILGDAFSGERRGRAVGLWAAAGAMTAAAAPLLGGWFVDGVGWRAVFLINLPIAAAAILLAWRCVPESGNPERPPPDWQGAILATLGLGALTWGLTAWSAARALSPTSGGAAAAGALLLILFLFVERRRGAEAMVPLSMFGSRAFVGLTLMTFLLYGAFGGMMVLLPYALISAHGYSALAAGAALLPLPILIAFGSPPMGRLAERIGPRLPLTIGPLIVAGGFLLAMRIGSDGHYWTTVFPTVAVLAAGMAVAVAPLTTAVLASVGPNHTGTASGLNSAVARTGGLIATALLGAALAGAAAGGFGGASAVGAVVAAAAGLSAWLLLRPA
ncbi:MAG: MFS transporter [Alphaproteobacteria bacterium]|nr:MAG: MFS transporter [Alphaproteobacteria bacterium]